MTDRAIQVTFFTYTNRQHFHLATDHDTGESIGHVIRNSDRLPKPPAWHVYLYIGEDYATEHISTTPVLEEAFNALLNAYADRIP